MSLLTSRFRSMTTIFQSLISGIVKRRQFDARNARWEEELIVEPNLEQEG